jgi:cytochrome c oxidase accessory protein FixG
MDIQAPRARSASIKPAVAEDQMYAKHQKVYPRQVRGTFTRLRLAAVVVLLGIYYLLPWVSWEGRQAVLFDLPARKFYVFGWTFWPQDFFFLALLLIIAALSLFFFTALAGRLWCGYACPQTVWTEVFLWMERLVEGDRAQQMKLDRAPWSARKLRLKATKQFLWVGFAAFTGFTFVAYFTPLAELWQNVVTFSLGPWEAFWIVFYGFATYGNAGYLREQVCVYMCPYARFQSAMFDDDTLVISYDDRRGEPRGSRKRGTDLRAKGLGECVDCTLCVQVCPTGIDIRDGLQYQCIGCAACIDACNDVMDKVGYPRGLIRYTTENTLQGRGKHVLRPRVLIYGSLLLALLIGLGYAIASRVPVGIDVIRDRNVLYRETDEGLVENVYQLRLINRSDIDREYRLEISGIDGLQLVDGDRAVRIPAGDLVSVPVQVRIDPIHLQQPSSQVEFRIEALDDPAVSQTQVSRFLGPMLR